MMPDTAVILCAGQGQTMRPLTLLTPKPLLSFAGMPILSHVLARLRDSGIRRIVISVHHLAEQIVEYCAEMRDVTIVHEASLLHTGGAVASMIRQKLVPDQPFFVVNGDCVWVNGPTDALRRMVRQFKPEGADVMLMLARTASTTTLAGRGDFLWPRDCGLRRRGELDVAPYIFAGVQIVTPALFVGAPNGPVSMNLLWDRAIEAGRMSAMVHDGLWFHLSTPEDLAAANAMLAMREVANTT